MIEIRYSVRSGKTNAMAEISGSWKDFEILRQDILNFLESNKETVYFVADKNIEGWNFVLESLEINQKGESVKVSVVENKRF
jgi:hypothetical protein